MPVCVRFCQFVCKSQPNIATDSGNVLALNSFFHFYLFYFCREALEFCHQQKCDFILNSTEADFLNFTLVRVCVCVLFYLLVFDFFKNHSEEQLPFIYTYPHTVILNLQIHIYAQNINTLTSTYMPTY